MVQSWKPDTCDCEIIHDKEYNVINSTTAKDGKVRKTTKCPDHIELDDTDLLPFVISENQSANEFYVKWSEKEIIDNSNLIHTYKKAFKEKKILDPIRDQTPANAKLALDTILNLKRFGV